MNTGSVYVPKFQRAVMELTNFSASLFDQFQMVDGRGDVDVPAAAKEHKITRLMFMNLLVYLGVLDPVLSVVEGSGGIVPLSNLGVKVGKISRREALDLFKRRIHIDFSRTPTAARLRREAIPKKEQGFDGLMTHSQFEAVIQVLIDMLHDSMVKASQDDPFRPLPPPPKNKKLKALSREASRDDLVSTSTLSIGQEAGKVAVADRASVSTRNQNVQRPCTATKGGGEVVGGAGNERPKTATAAFRSVIKTPIGPFIRISSRRADAETSSFDKVVAHQKLALPLASASVLDVEDDSRRAHTSRPHLSSSATPSRPSTSLFPTGPWKQHHIRTPRLRVSQFERLLHVAPCSSTESIQYMAAGPLTALATMSAKDNRVLNQYGAVEVMLDMVLNLDSPMRVRADALEWCVCSLNFRYIRFVQLA